MPPPEETSGDSETSIRVYTPSTTSASTAKHGDNHSDTNSSIPWPDSTFMIQSTSNGKVITFLDAKIVLAPPGGLGIYRWRCVQKDGWLGFQDPASLMFLGWGNEGFLCCTTKTHKEHEYFCVRPLPQGGHALLAYGKTAGILCPMGAMLDEDGIGIKHWDSPRMSWVFVKVPG